MTKKLPTTKQNKAGFTIIEVMLFLAISGLLLIGVLGGTYSSIATQRYNDSVRGFSEFLRQTYAEVLSPESLGSNSTSDKTLGNSNDQAIYGKILVFGLEEDSDDQDANVYTATLVGDPTIPTSSGTFIWELGQVDAELFCGTDDNSHESSVSTYRPLWGAKIQNDNDRPFEGTVIIARSPTSGTVHTVYTEEKINIKENCRPGSTTASSNLQIAIKNRPGTFVMEDIDFCIKSQNSRIIRDIRLEGDGHNTSAINLLSADDSEVKCQQQN